MPGFDYSATYGAILFANNVDFTGTSATAGTAQVTANGQLLIGSTVSPHIRVNTLTPGPGISIVNGNGSITISATMFSIAYTNVTHAMSPYTVLLTDEYLSCDTSEGVITLNFPNAPTSLRTWIVKDRTGNAAVSNITLTTPGAADTFDGGTTYVMNSNFASVQLLANSSNNYEIY